jgi:acyl carrier protein
MTIEARIRRYIDDFLLDEPFAGADPIAAEALDSQATEELIDFLEDEYHVVFSDEELARERFASIPAIVALIEAKRTGAVSP